jgi:lambda family phage tail tape measure protein
MSLIARLGVMLGINVDEFVKGMDTAARKNAEFEYNTRKMARRTEESFALLFSAVQIGVAAIGVGMVDALKRSNDLVDISKSFSVSLESLIATQSALNAAGNQADNYVNIFSKLADSQDQAKEGSDKLRDAFYRIGIAGKDVQNLSLDALFLKVANALSKVEDSTVRVSIQQEILGKAIKGINWEDFIQKYKSFSDPELVAKIEKNGEAWEKIEKAIKNIKNLFIEIAAPLADAINKVEKLANNFSKLGLEKYGIGGVLALLYGPNAVANMPDQKGQSISGKVEYPGVIAAVTKDKSGYSKPSGEETSAAKAAAAEAKRLAAEKAKELKEQAELMKKIYDQEQKFKVELNEIQQTQFKLLQSYAEEYSITKEQLALEGERYRLTSDQYNTIKLLQDQKYEILNIEKKYRDQELEAISKLEEAKSEDSANAKKLFDEKIKNINESKDLELMATKEIQEIKKIQYQEEIDRQYNWQQGWHEAYRNYAEDSSKAARYGAEAFNTVISSMEGALEKFVRTGKLNFKDLIGSMIKDLIVLQMKAQATKLFTQLLGSVGLGNSGGSANAVGLATGGKIDGPRLVGENGPELFVPRQSGTIIPNGAWQSQMSGQGQTVINGPYIARVDAIDAKTFEQYVMGSNKAVWAANQYAQKSLALGAGRT